MKPAAFEYYDPMTLVEALDLLAQLGEGARVLAGGQSLVPMMNFRLVRPSHLVDLNRVGELRYLRVENGGLRIGAMTRQRELERSAVVAEGWPLLRELTRHIGHVQIRTRGTVGGSLAHAYPSAELPLAMITLEAEFLLRSRKGERTVRAEDFFVTYMTTVLEPSELLVEIRIPPVPPRTGWAFQEVSRRHGDFALVGVAALLTLDEGGVIRRARLAFTGPTPVRRAKAEELLVSERPGKDLFHEATGLAVQDLEQDTDIHASADYRREVAGVLARNVLEQAAGRALGGGKS
ncbi:MAG: FAD binding domain-containing protein [Candidatus Binatia bacterium]